MKRLMVFTGGRFLFFLEYFMYSFTRESERVLAFTL